MAYFNLEDFINSKFYYSQALLHVQCFNLFASGYNIIYNNISVLYKHVGDFKLALEFVDKSLACRANNHYEDEVKLLINKGEILHCLNKLNEAAECYEKAKNILESLENIYKIYPKHSKIHLFYCYGQLLEEMGEKEKSEEFFKEARLIKTCLYPSESVRDDGKLKQVEAIELYQDGKISSAYNKLVKAKYNNDVFGSGINQINTLISVGSILLLKNNLNGLVSYYQALELTYKLNVKNKRVIVLERIGKYFSENENYETSLSYLFDAYNLCMEIYGDMDNRHGANTCLGIARNYGKLNEFEKSIDFAEKSLVYFEKFAKKKDYENETYNNLRIAYHLLGINYGKLTRTKINEEKQIYYLENCLIQLYISMKIHFSEQEMQEIESKTIDSVVFSLPERKINELIKATDYIHYKLEEKQ